MTRSEIDAATRSAYEAAIYRIETTPEIYLVPTQRCDQLITMFADAGVESAAFITACNPYSQLLSDHENAVRQGEMELELKGDNYKLITGTGSDPCGIWPGEPSVLVLGIDLQSARNVGERWGQNAIIWISEFGIPQLELLR